jgi:transcriptional regulator with XRE-family HTH domain
MQVSTVTNAALNALQDLVRGRLERQGWSYGDVARRGGIPRSTVHHLATTDRLVRMPQPTTLEGLARGLELPLDVVRRAAAEACGIHVYEAAPDPEVDVLIASLQQLSTQDRRHVAALVESLLERGRQPEPADSAAEAAGAAAGAAESAEDASEA